MNQKAVISLTTGLEDPEKVTVAFLVAVAAAESGRPTLMFQTKEAVRLALEGIATGTACEGCPPLRDLLRRYEQAGGRYMVPDLLQRQGARQGQPAAQRRNGRNGPALGVDRRRGRHHVQLLGGGGVNFQPKSRAAAS
jgi:predicted peroxiredoxin